MTDAPLPAATRDELAMLIDGAADGVIAVDSAGAAILVNDPAAKMPGFASARRRHSREARPAGRAASRCSSRSSR